MYRKGRRAKRARRPASRASVTAFNEHKEVARTLVLARLTRFAPLVGVTLRKVYIKNSRSRWGSCSVLGNLNFNYRIVFLTPELLDYVVVHELCHLVHFNHSRAFWGEVEKLTPNWRALRRQLRTIHL